MRTPRYSTRARARRYAWFNEQKNRPCADCNHRYPPYVMDFDHVRGKKLKAVGQLLTSRSLAVVIAEIAKCDLVCANCHRERTYWKAGKKRRAEKELTPRKPGPKPKGKR